MVEKGPKERKRAGLIATLAEKTRKQEERLANHAAALLVKKGLNTHLADLLLAPAEKKVEENHGAKNLKKEKSNEKNKDKNRRRLRLRTSSS